MTLPLIEKYRAKTISEIKGQDSVISDVKSFLTNFPKKRAIILSGPVGTGKTSLAIAFAKENDMELFELNASDLRNRSKLEEVLAPAIKQQSLFKKSKLILMDEADGITGTDRGGLPELIALIDKTSFPIIITANDIWNKKFNLLRKKCQIVSVKELKEEIVFNIITEIVKKEEKTAKSEVLLSIAKKSKGDVRAAINDLESLFSLGEEEYNLDINEREKEESIFSILKKLFQNPPDETTIRLYDNTNMNMDEISLWIEENLPAEYQGTGLAKAYLALAIADLFKGRIYRQQHWRFLVYQNFFLSAGISCATKLKSKKFINYKRPSRILKIWLANQKNAKKKSIVAKYAKFSHMSKKKAMRNSEFIPFIIGKEMSKKLDLDEKEEKWLEEKKGAIIIANKLNKFRN